MEGIKAVETPFSRRIQYHFHLLSLSFTLFKLPYSHILLSFLTLSSLASQSLSLSYSPLLSLFRASFGVCVSLTWCYLLVQFQFLKHLFLPRSFLALFFFFFSSRKEFFQRSLEHFWLRHRRRQYYWRTRRRIRGKYAANIQCFSSITDIIVFHYACTLLWFPGATHHLF